MLLGQLVLTVFIIVHSVTGASHTNGKVVSFYFNKGFSGKPEDQVLTAADGNCMSHSRSYAKPPPTHTQNTHVHCLFCYPHACSSAAISRIGRTFSRNDGAALFSRAPFSTCNIDIVVGEPMGEGQRSEVLTQQLIGALCKCEGSDAVED